MYIYGYIKNRGIVTRDSSWAALLPTHKIPPPTVTSNNSENTTYILPQCKHDTPPRKQIENDDDFEDWSLSPTLSLITTPTTDLSCLKRRCYGLQDRDIDHFEV